MVKHVIRCQIRFVNKAKRAYIHQTATAAGSFPVWLGVTPLILSFLPLCFFVVFDVFSRIRLCSIAR